MFHLPTLKVHSNALLLQKLFGIRYLRFATVSSICHDTLLKSNTKETSKTFELLKRYSLNDHFAKPNTSWNICMAQAKALVNYDTDLYQETVMSDEVVEKFFTSQKLNKSKHLQSIVSQFVCSNNYQITGLTTILFAKLFLYSKSYWPNFFYTSSADKGNQEILDAKLETDIVQLAQCHDMISYGFYFHDCISPIKTLSTKNSLKSLQLLLGDYFFAKALHKMASFSQIELYNSMAHTTVMISEGESLSLTLSEDFDESKTIQKLVDYCHFSSGHLVGSSFQSALYQANFSTKAQKFAFEFGKNVGIAIKIANQLSALFASKLTNGDSIFDCQLPVNHLNLSCYAKFPTINAEVMQNLVEDYSNRAVRLLDILCDPHALTQLEELLDNNDWTTTINIQQLQLGQSSEVRNSGQGSLSAKSAEIRESLFQIIKQIQSFNSQNFACYNGLFAK